MKGKRAFIGACVAATALIAGLALVFPILYGVLGAFKTPQQFTAYPPTLWPQSFGYLDNFRQALELMPLGRYMLNSLVVALMSVSAKLAFAILAAYAIACFQFKGKNFLFFLVLGTMMLPADTLIITNYQTVARMKLLDTYLGMCLTSFVGASQMFMLRQSFLSAPRALKDAAVLDGCGDMRYLLHILLPINWPVVFTLFVQGFVTAWNAYLWPLLVTNKSEMRTVQVGITMLTTAEGTNYAQVLAGVALTMVPAVILFLFLRRRLVGGMTAGALAG